MRGKGLSRLLSAARTTAHDDARRATVVPQDRGVQRTIQTQRDRRQTRDRHAIFMIYLLDRVAVRMSRCSTQPARPRVADEPDSRRHDLAVARRYDLERL